MRLYIKNMVCTRCKLVVKTELERLGLGHTGIREGEVELFEPIPDDRFQTLKQALLDLGLEVIDDRESILVEKIRHSISEMVYSMGEGVHIPFSEHLSAALGYSYHYLSNLFSTVHGTSIEKSIIHQKIDRVKEILIHEDITFSEIAFKVHFSSSAHLSAQFRKETGLTLSQFRSLHSGKKRRGV